MNTLLSGQDPGWTADVRWTADVTPAQTQSHRISHVLGNTKTASRSQEDSQAPSVLRPLSVALHFTSPWQCVTLVSSDALARCGASSQRRPVFGIICFGAAAAKKTAIMSSDGRTRCQVVVLGDPGTGKSSLIAAVSTDSFPEKSPPVLPPTRLPNDFYPDRVPLIIIDTSSRSVRTILVNFRVLRLWV